jgi:hypothetical protein
MSEATNYPSFYEPTEGRPPVGKEQFADASQAFNRLFDDIMLSHMDQVKQFEPIKGRPTAYLLRYIEVDRQKYTLALKDASLGDLASDTSGIEFRDSERIARSISLQRIEQSYGRELWDYRLCADGIIRRWDGGDITAKRRKDRELGIERPKMLSGNESFEEIGRVVLTSMHRLVTDTIPNRRLEEDMGLNNQPVTPSEIRGLQDFLARAIETSL